MNDYLAEKFKAFKPILYRLFPNSEIEFLFREDIFWDDYFLSIHNIDNRRLGYLKISLAWKNNENKTLFSLQLFRDFTYQVDYFGKGFSWFKEGRYTKPDNYQEIENILKEIWDILA